MRWSCVEAGIRAKVEAQGWRRHGGQASRLGGLGQSRTPRPGTGEEKMEGCRAKHRLWLPVGRVPPAGHPTACCGDRCLVELGLCDPTEWHRACGVGGNLSLLWANHAGRQGFRKQNWSHPVQRSRMEKRMSLKPSLWWCSSSYLKAREKIASCSDVCPVAAHKELLTLPPAKLCSTVPTSLGRWQELKRRIYLNLPGCMPSRREKYRYSVLKREAV